jgi:anti-sigma factor RsiW
MTPPEGHQWSDDMDTDLGTDMDAVMMDAIDGTLGPADRARLDAHLARHPEHRVMFDRLLRTDLALRKTPPAPLPIGFGDRVLASARGTRIARPITRAQLAAFIVANSVLMMLAWLISGVVFAALALFVLQQPVIQPALVFVRSAAVYMAELMGLFSSLVRTATNQPAFWVGAFATAALVAVWFGLMARILRPARHYAR